MQGLDWWVAGLGSLDIQLPALTLSRHKTATACVISFGDDIPYRKVICCEGAMSVSCKSSSMLEFLGLCKKESSWLGPTKKINFLCAK